MQLAKKLKHDEQPNSNLEIYTKFISLKNEILKVKSYSSATEQIVYMWNMIKKKTILTLLFVTSQQKFALMKAKAFVEKQNEAETWKEEKVASKKQQQNARKRTEKPLDCTKPTETRVLSISPIQPLKKGASKWKGKECSNVSLDEEEDSNDDKNVLYDDNDDKTTDNDH